MTQIRVLYVDDDPDIREVVEFSLALDPDIEFQVVESGGKALAAFEAGFRPHLALLDVNMPGMSGPELLAEMRATPAYGDILVAFMTARANKAEEKADLIARGAIAVLAKPFDPLKLAADVKALVLNA